MGGKRRKVRLAPPVKRTITIILIAIPLLALVYPALHLATHSLTIFPAAENRNSLLVYTDNPPQEKSVVEEFSTTGGLLKLKYILKGGAANPMVFFILTVGTFESTTGGPLDISRFDAMSVVFRKATIRNVCIFIKTIAPGISLPGGENAITLRHNQYILELVPDVRHYTVELKKFITPDWWLTTHELSNASLPPEDYKQVISFDMQFNRGSSYDVLGKHEEVIIESIAFTKQLSGINQILLVSVVLYYACFFTVQLVQSIRSYLLEVPQQKPVEVTTYYEQDLIRIREFLQLHYNDPGISTRMLYEELGIPQPRVYELLRREYNLTCKQLINRMRIEEAKRLLRETDLRVTDIAVNLGFNNVSYFNNLFKTETGVAPSEFRDKKY